MQAKEIRIEAVQASFGNDRTVFADEGLRELAESMAANGLAQPITVRRVSENGQAGAYQIIAGERRFRAARLLGWETIPAIVQKYDDRQAGAVMLAENTARVDLNPIEEGGAFQRRLDQGWTVGEVAKAAGKSAVYVQFRVKLLALRAEVRDLVATGQMPIGYAQILADADLDPNRQTIAVRLLSRNASPTPAWFRQECQRLAGEQAQPDMFADVLFLSPTPSAPVIETPSAPIPGETTPPAASGTPAEIFEAQIAFWLDAADQWKRYGKNFKRGECLAAAAALQAVRSSLGF